jgi:hypothetical protein
LIPGSDREDTEGVHQCALPFDSERPDLDSRNGIAGKGAGRMADEDLTRFRGLLQARRNIHRLPGHKGLTAPRIIGQDLPGGRADANPEGDRPTPCADSIQPPDCADHLYGGASRADGVVFMDQRNSENGHDGVTDELLHHAAVALENPAHLSEIAIHELPGHLWSDALDQLVQAVNIGKDHSHGLAGLRIELGFDGERPTTGGAIPRIIWPDLAAAPTDGHAVSLRGFSSGIDKNWDLAYLV